MTWYTVSLVLVTKDDKNGMAVGGSLAYIMEKEDFDRYRMGLSSKEDLVGGMI